MKFGRPGDRRTGRSVRSSRMLIAGLAITALMGSSASSVTALRAPKPGGHMHPAIGLHLNPQSAARDTTGGFHCQQPSAKLHCYGPAQIPTAYAIQPLIDAGKNGSGETITIIDAYQNPTMVSDLASFDKAFALPAPRSFRIIAPQGLTPFDPNDPNQVGWSGEIALDVEWAHAVAPGAKIVLALAASDADADLLNTQRYVINQRIGNVISMSFAEAEECMDPGLQTQEHALFETATARGVTLLAGSGDWGAAQYSCDLSSFIKAVATPASDPDVTGVGGTKLRANLQTGAYHSESVWNEFTTFGVAGGGGFSSLYSRPTFQRGVSGIGAMRGVPDVAITAAIDYGVLVAWGSSGTPGGVFWIFGGTSVGAPLWSGIVAIADQSVNPTGLGNINASLYALGRKAAATNFHDITTGNNDFPPISGYSAGPGWDAASGWGSPIAAHLVASLENHN